MKYIIDTHAFIWYAVGDARVSSKVIGVLESDIEKFISIVSIWEMAIKVNIGHLEFKNSFDDVVSNQIDLLNYRILNINLEHLFKLSTLELHHRDPFDRLIISQALVEKIPIISVDEKFDKYGIERIW
ncbi:MAG: hypothetical protein QG657_3169 [Acidobacteriota bacterium]|nr:hypothetical protein [Acidobacteriota bacterium]